MLAAREATNETSASATAWPAELLGSPLMADDPCLAAFSVAGTEQAHQYYRARYYDPKIGRFISEDPIGLRGGINEYSYVNNSPISATDPFGLFANWCRKGNDVEIVLPLTFTGEAGADPAYAHAMDFYRRKIEERWSGRFGKYKVNLKAPYAQSGQPTNTFVVGADPFKSIGIVDRIGGNMAWTELGDTSGVYAHEAGHLMGLDDQYDKTIGNYGKPLPGFEENIMADHAKRGWQSDIDSVMRSSVNKCICR